MAGAVATFPAVLTASKWISAYQSAWNRAQKAHGMATSSDGTVGPRLTNAEAASLINAWRIAAGVGFPLWYQFAAVAYGWSPDNDNLDTSAKQAGSSYLPDDLAVALWVVTQRLALDLDDGPSDPRLEMANAFGDPTFAGAVRAALLGDGAEAAFKIPLPVCRDKKTKKTRWPRPSCGKTGEFRDPITGAKVACDKPGDCEIVAVDDPITKVVKDVGLLVAILAAVWLLANKPRRRRRKRD